MNCLEKCGAGKHNKDRSEEPQYCAYRGSYAREAGVRNLSSLLGLFLVWREAALLHRECPPSLAGLCLAHGLDGRDVVVGALVAAAVATVLSFPVDRLPVHLLRERGKREANGVLLHRSEERGGVSQPAE